MVATDHCQRYSPLFLLLVFSCLEPVFPHYHRTFCKPTVKEGGKFTCFFNEDLQETKESICVYKVDTSDGDKKLESVVSCMQIDGQMKCFSRDGINAHAVNNYEIEVKLDNKTSGTRFACNTVPPHDDTAAEECDVFFEDESSNTDLSSSYANAGTDSATVKNPDSDSTNRKGSETGADNQGVSGLFISIGFNVFFGIVLVALIAVIVLMRIKEGKIKRLTTREELQDKAGECLMHV